MGPLCHTTPVTVDQVNDFSFCAGSLSQATSHILLGLTGLRLALSAMLLTLAVSSTLKESFVMYKATERWRPNHYMQLFVKDGILYFIPYVTAFPIPSVPLHSRARLTQVPAKELTALNTQECNFHHRFGLDPTRHHTKRYCTPRPSLALYYDCMHHHASVHHQRARAV